MCVLLTARRDWLHLRVRPCLEVYARDLGTRIAAVELLSRLGVLSRFEGLASRSSLLPDARV